MMEFKLTINRLNVRGGKLEIAVGAQGPWDPKVRDPKLTVLFNNGTQDRRLPLVVRHYEKLDDGSCYIFASYTYNLKFLFYRQPQNRKIDLAFELRYGHTVLDKAPFVIDYEDERAMDYLSGSNNPADSEEEDNNKKPSFIEYDIEFSKSKNSVTLQAIEGQEALFKSHKIRDGIFSVLLAVWKFILFLVSVALIPVYLVDAILAAIGCQNRNNKIHDQGIVYVLKHVRAKMDDFSKVKIGIIATKFNCMYIAHWIACLFPVKQNRVAFLSNRRDDLSGNFEFVNAILTKNPEWDLKYVLDSNPTRSMKWSSMIKIGWYMGNARVILVDDFSELFFKMPRRKGTYLMQLWHACGAFKTFGCSRIGRPGGPSQGSPNHRNYDFATVSSKDIEKFYAEGFGLSSEKVVATGIPRTDVFFDEAYKAKTKEVFYKEYPKLKDKKILLFAPTFRGNGKMSGYYPVDKLDVNQLYKDLQEEYAIIVKHHPFVGNRSKIDKKYKDFIIDLSDHSELNDLLFVTDVLITDYSSVVFEASLLNIPMILYAFDLDKYISSRGFYYEYEDMAPGKIVRNYKSLVDSIRNEDWENDKLEEFKKRFFDDLDGKSAQRTVDLIESCLKK